MTVAPIFSKSARKPSRFIVWKIRSEPGVTTNEDFDFNPAARQIADLVAKAQKTLDDKTQGQYVLEAQRLLNQHGPFAWLFENNQIIAYRTDRIKRLSVNAIWYFDVMHSELA